MTIFTQDVSNLAIYTIAYCLTMYLYSTIQWTHFCNVGYMHLFLLVKHLEINQTQE